MMSFPFFRACWLDHITADLADKNKNFKHSYAVIEIVIKNYGKLVCCFVSYIVIKYYNKILHVIFYLVFEV